MKRDNWKICRVCIFFFSGSDHVVSHCRRNYLTPTHGDSCVDFHGIKHDDNCLSGNEEPKGEA